eukprot:3992314-Karenia_brevis.AAC.1
MNRQKSIDDFDYIIQPDCQLPRNAYYPMVGEKVSYLAFPPPPFLNHRAPSLNHDDDDDDGADDDDDDDDGDAD